MFSMRFRVENS